MSGRNRAHALHRQIQSHVRRYGVADAQRVFCQTRKYIRYHAQESTDGSISICHVIEKGSWGGARNFALSEADELELSVLLLDYIQRHPTEGLKVHSTLHLSLRSVLNIA